MTLSGLSPPGRKAKILLAFLLAFTALVALFDSNWLRRPLERYLTEKSSREIRIENLRVELGAWLEPTLRLRGVYIENAPWAAQRPFATAGEVSFTVSLSSLWQGRPVVARLVLVDADVDMERQADGRRNWRLKHPEDRSPGRVRVLTLETHRTKIRFVNRAIDLELVAEASPAEDNASGRTDEKGLSTRIAFKGSYQGAAFSGIALTDGVLSFRGSGVSFPLRGHMTSGKTRLELDGFFTDVFDLGPMDTKMRLAGATLSQLHPFLRVRPPPSRPFDFEAQLTQTHDVYRFSQLKGKIGDTDIAGEATYDRSPDRPRVHAELQSAAADVADLGPLLGMRYFSRDAKSGGKPATASDEQPQTDADAARRRSGRIFPAHVLRTERLRTLDARLTIHVRKLKAPDIPMLESLRLSAALTDGVLELKPFDLGLAGGHIVGSIAFDGRQQPPSSRATLELRGIRLERLLPSLSAAAGSAGVIRGQISLAGRGQSIATLLGNSTGSVSARMDGARISNLADAKLGLNGGKILSLLIRGDRDIAVHCGAIAFDFRNGTGKSRTIVLDTEQTRTDGIGSIDLRDERWDLVLTPQPKKPGLLTRRASIHAQGSFKTADVSIQERVVMRRGGVAANASNGNGNPADAPCAAVLAAAPAGKSSASAPR